MLKLKTLEIIKYFDVERTTLRFHDKRNVLLGKNGSGKTTLLKLISMILRGDLSELAKSEFELRFTLQDGKHNLDVWVRNSPRVAIVGASALLEQAVAAAFQAEAELRYQNAEQGKDITIRTRDGVSSVEPAREVFTKGRLDPTDPQYFIVCFFSLGWLPSLQEGAVRIDEGLGYLGHILGESASPVFTLRAPEGSFFSLQWGSTAPHFFGQRLASQREIDRVTFRNGEGIALLDRFVAHTRFHGAELRFDLIETAQHTTGNSVQLQFGNPALYCTRADGRRFDHHKLSFGQQRLWSILYYLACSPDCFIADEMVNGLHRDWIVTCLHELGDRQAFLTSQNPLLFDFLSFTSPEDVQQQFVLCKLDEQDPRRRMRWQQIPDKKAYEFFQAYRTGMQSVNEILEVEGLW